MVLGSVVGLQHGEAPGHGKADEAGGGLWRNARPTSIMSKMGGRERWEEFSISSAELDGPWVDRPALSCGKQGPMENHSSLLTYHQKAHSTFRCFDVF